MCGSHTDVQRQYFICHYPGLHNKMFCSNIIHNILLSTLYGKMMLFLGEHGLF